MVIYSYTNRRRAKDAIMAVCEIYTVEEVCILCKNGLTYVELQCDHPEIMHFGEPCIETSLTQLFDWSQVQEYYAGIGVVRFKV
jgi:hypothetical protein